MVGLVLILGLVAPGKLLEASVSQNPDGTQRAPNKLREQLETRREIVPRVNIVEPIYEIGCALDSCAFP